MWAYKYFSVDIKRVGGEQVGNNNNNSSAVLLGIVDIGDKRRDNVHVDLLCI